METLALSPVTQSPFLDSDVLKNLESYEEYLSFYLQLDEASSAFSWFKADLLNQMHQKLGEGSIEQLSKDVKQPRSTVINYVRVAKAFPKETREPAASFSIHIKASFVDSFNTEKQEFETNDRFDWVKRALDENFSTRGLEEAIKREKQRLLLAVDKMPCTFCKLSDGEINPYVMYSPNGHEEANRFELHKDCLNRVLNFIENNNIVN